MHLHPSYQPDPVHLGLGDGFSDPVEVPAFADPVLRHRDDAAAERIGLHTLDDADWLDAFVRFAPLPGNLPAPRALRYHGHQFRHYNPDLGDGRGFLYAQCRDADGALLELGTKGSGPTRWARGGDGRLTLQGGVREILAAALLQARGVPTCQIVSLIETGEPLVRHDEPSPTRSCVMVRLQGCHLRIGTVQRLATLGQAELLARLVDHVLEVWYPGLDPGPVPAVTLLDQVVGRTAHLVATWMNAGFVHGVLNTDNLTLTGESFDYGPWRFTPTFDPSFVAAYFDHGGLYAFGRQPEACQWALDRLADALRLVADGDALDAVTATFVERFRVAWRDGLLRRLALAPTTPAEDDRRARTVISFLAQSGVPLEGAIWDLRGGAVGWRRALDGPRAATYRRPEAAPLAWLADAEPAGPVPETDAPVTLWIDEVRALWAAIAERDDWTPLRRALAAIRADAVRDHAGPTPARPRTA